MKLVMLGTGSPPPDVERAGPSQVVVVDDAYYLVDCGAGATVRLLEAGIPLAGVTRLLFTHLHSDHTVGYGHFLLGGWSAGRRELVVVGPPGIRHLHRTMVQDLYARDIEYRLSLGRPGSGLTDVQPVEVEGGEVYADERVRVTAVPVVHDVFTMAFRFEAADGCIVLSGDTAYTPDLVQLARGADILVHDAAMCRNRAYSDPNPEKQGIWQKLHRYHATPAEAGRVARAAGVKKLVLTHFLPGTDAEAAQAEAAAEFDGEVYVGADLLTVEC